MQEIARTIKELESRGVKLRLEDRRLSVTIPDRSLEPEIRALLASSEAEIAEYLRSDSAPIQGPSQESIGPLEGSTDISSGQRRLWFLHRQNPNSLAHNIPMSWVVRGRLDPTALDEALTELVERHEALRTSFRFDGQHLCCTPSVISTPLLDYVDLTDADDDDSAQRRRLELGRAFFSRPFDLSRDTLLRAQLIRVSEDCFDLHLCVHHIAFDGWSSAIFNRELADAYQNRLRTAATANGSGEKSVRPTERGDTVDYRRFARWQNALLAGSALDGKLDYWRQKLDGLSTRTTLAIAPRQDQQAASADGSGSPPTGATGGSASHVLDRQLTRRVHEFASAHRVTSFMVLLSAFNALLHRYSGNEDIAIGTASAYRTRAEFEKIVGFFVNALVLRTRLSAEMSFLALIKQVRQTSLEAFENQDVPFEKLVEVLRPARRAGVNPFFDVMFIYQNTPEGRLRLGGATLDPQRPPTIQSALDLSMSCRESDGQVTLHAWFDGSKFSRPMIERMLKNFETILSSALTKPAAAIGELDLLSAPERTDLLGAWSGEAVRRGLVQNSTRPRSIIERFDETVATMPDAPAVVVGDRSVRYAELQGLSLGVAANLGRLGVRARDRVAVRLPRGLDTVVCMLAVLRIRASWVPLEVSHPAQRHRQIIADSQCRVVVIDNAAQDDTARAWAGEIGRDGGSSPKLVAIDELLQSAEPRHADDADATAVSFEQPAYVIYTSGSTGHPKGVLGMQHGILNRIDWMQSAYPLKHGDAVCHKTSLAFVDSIWEVFGTLLAGARLVIASAKVVGDPRAMTELLANSQITHLVAVPSYLDALCDWIETSGAVRPALRMLISSGETLSAPLYARLRKVLGSCTILNVYGSTEISADATWLELNPEETVGKPGIGRPIAGALTYVLDERLQLQPVGVQGEICVGGLVVSGGYLNQSELTAERFVANPYSDGLMFRTGDMGYFDDRGCLYLTGRRDRQIKIRGSRVEPQEIEAACLKLDGVRSCCVEPIHDGDRPPYLVLYYAASAREQPAPEIDEIRRALRRKLPEYMVPQYIRRIEQLPMTPTGKVDRTRLREMFSELTDAASTKAPEPTGAVATGAAPDHLLESVMALWANVLGHRRFGANDEFFDVGGHSLLGIRLIHALQTRFGLPIPIAIIFQAPSASAMAAWIMRQQANSSDAMHGNAAPPIDRAAFSSVRQGVEGSPVFLFPPNGTTAMYFQEILSKFELRRPIFAMRCELARNFDSMKVLGDNMLEQLLAIQPNGPYRMVSACLGAHFAYDLALRLAARGEEVVLVVIDASNPLKHGEPNRNDGMENSPLRHLRTAYRALVKEGLRYSIHRARLRVRARNDPQVRSYMALSLHQTTLLRQYRATPAPIRVVHIESDERHRQGLDSRGWSGLAGAGYENAVIPGSSHYELNTAHSRFSADIAAIIKRTLGA